MLSAQRRVEREGGRQSVRREWQYPVADGRVGVLSGCPLTTEHKGQRREPVEKAGSKVPVTASTQCSREPWRDWEEAGIAGTELLQESGRS